MSMPQAKLNETILASDYENGKSVLYLAKKFKCSASAVSRRLRKLGIKTRPFSTKGLQTRLGAKLSQKTRNKIRRKAIGREIPYEVRKRMGSPGAKNSGWIDGRTPEHKRQRRTVEYRLWRKAVFERDNFTCRKCGKRGGNLNADHIKPFARYPELRTSIENGRTLCTPCHKKTPTFGNGAKRQLKFYL